MLGKIPKVVAGLLSVIMGVIPLATNTTESPSSNRTPTAITTESTRLYTEGVDTTVGTYTVQKGDCIELIAQYYNCSEETLMAMNPGYEWQYIYPGDVVNVPVQVTVQEQSDVEQQSSVETQSNVEQQSSVETQSNVEQQSSVEMQSDVKTSEYQVEWGDYFYGLVDKFNCSEEELTNANPNYNWNYIMPGDIINVPKTCELSYEEPKTCNEEKEVLAGTATVYVYPDSDSWYNIELSLSYLEGMTLHPSEIFSWEQYMGANSCEQGYRTAPIIVGNERALGWGGGVCVTATALFQAERNAQMSTIERHEHSLPVSYAAAEDSATISYGSCDLKFQNNTQHTYVCHTYSSYGCVTVSFYEIS